LLKGFFLPKKFNSVAGVGEGPGVSVRARLNRLGGMLENINIIREPGRVLVPMDNYPASGEAIGISIGRNGLENLNLERR
jgi:hypothetical protein